jgi:hypothetical protein
MKVLSFDVGIKNLAYCIVEWNDSNNLIIHNWNTINFVENINIDEKCIYNNCKTKAKSFMNINNTKYHFCSKHVNKKDDIINNIIDNYTEKNWIESNNLICSKCIPCDDIIISKKKYYSNNKLNIIYCNKHYKSFITKLNNDITKVNLIKNKTVKNILCDDLKYNLIKFLDENKNIMLSIADIVVIENQPTLKNPTMKAVSDTIYSWFMIRGIIDKNINNSTIEKIKFMSPSNKLKKFNPKEDTIQTYKETKKLAIENCSTILKMYNMDNWLLVLNNNIKKDDLSDCFLQGWYALNDHYKNILLEEYNNKKNENIIL